MHRRSFVPRLAAALLSSLFLSPFAAALLPVKPTLLPVTVTLAANNVTVAQGAAVILTATVTPNTAPAASVEQNPTGTIVFLNGTAVIGQSALAALPVNNSSTAALTIQSLPTGEDSITAYFAGDNIFAAGTSDPLAIDVQGFSLAPSSTNPATNLKIVRGQSGSESFVLTSASGYTGQVQVVCAVQLQDDMTCTPTPQQVTPTATVTFAIQTFASGGPEFAANIRRRNAPLWPQAAAGTALAGLFFFAVPLGRLRRVRNRLRRSLVLLLLLAPLMSSVASCNSSTLLAPNGTPLGVATLRVVATAYVDNAVTSQTLYFTVDVQPQ
jgi:hypothetical protein